MNESLSIVKIGGHVIEDKEALNEFLALFAALPAPKILVHGGGKMATRLAEKLEIPTTMVNGRRVTDVRSLEVITMVYAGLANKNMVAALQAQHCNAIGLSGADADSVRAHKRPVKDIDFGFVGDVDRVNTTMITTLLRAGLTPVFCAMTHDGHGQLLNTNADTIASELAIGLSAHYRTGLYYCFEKKGVLANLKDDDSVIQHIDLQKYKELLSKGSIADGMLPKLENCFHALKNKVGKVCLGNMGMLRQGNNQYTTLTL